MKDLRALRAPGIVAGFLVVLAFVWVAFRLGEEPWHGAVEGSGPYSALTRTEIDTVASGSNILFPVDLPAGLGVDAHAKDFEGQYRVDGVTYRGDQAPFYLTRIEAAPSVDVHQRTVVTEYQSAVIGGTDRVRYEVRQFPATVPGDQVCNSQDGTAVVRHVGETQLTICGPGLEHGTAAWDYWTSVDFVSDTDRVAWLRG